MVKKVRETTIRAGTVSKSSTNKPLDKENTKAALFKTFGDENLRQLMSGYGLTSSDMKVVLDKKRENLYQVACLRLFEMTHKGSIAENVGNHPNAYFNSSL